VRRHHHQQAERHPTTATPPARFGREARVQLELPLLIDAAFAAAAAMISYCALVGKTSPAQTQWLAVLQVPVSRQLE
jgi:hypothetical protein